MVCMPRAEHRRGLVTGGCLTEKEIERMILGVDLFADEDKKVKERVLTPRMRQLELRMSRRRWRRSMSRILGLPSF